MEKRGLTAALIDAGLTATSRFGWEDALRVGLRGAPRRVWGRRGVKVRQRIQFVYEWRYLLLAVDGRTGTLWWNWNGTMAAEELIPLVRGMRERAWLDAIAWDGAPSHRDRRIDRVGLPRISLPPYSPELNPAERVFEEIRRVIEGIVYATLNDKVAAVERVLQALDADPAPVQRLCGWQWIHAAFTASRHPRLRCSHARLVSKQVPQIAHR